MKKRMRLTVMLAGAVFALALAGCEAAENESADQVQGKDKNRTEIQQVEGSQCQSIVRVEEPGQTGHGTGVLIGQNKLLTNKHVAESFEKSRMLVRVKNDAGEFFDFKVKNVAIAPNENADLALIEVSPGEDGETIDDKVKRFELASREDIKKVKEGDNVNTIGYPGDKQEGTLWDSKGKVLMFGGNFLTYDAFISGGNSGSPLFNEEGKIIGLSNAGNDETEEGIVSFGFLLTDELYTFIEEEMK